MNTIAASSISAQRVKQVWQREVARFNDLHPESLRQHRLASQHFLYGVPLHWMQDWPSPSPLFLKDAQGARLTCVDGMEYDDFCLGDTGAMFGHAPAPLSAMLADTARTGLTAMLPSSRTVAVGERLAQMFGLPFWQLATTASDANRFVIRWARAMTGRSKVLVFDGCYHGTVDDTLVDLVEGKTTARDSLLGQVYDLTEHSVSVPFNDIAAVRQALAQGDVALVLTEPALTNCGMVLPQPGFLEELSTACRQHGTLLALDETHTLSTAWGGYTRAWGLCPDFLVAGKAIAGGIPCAVYGFSSEIARGMRAAKQAAAPGHSGIGTTLSGSQLAMQALAVTLEQVITPAAYDHAIGVANGLAQGLEEMIQSHHLPWSVTRLGARLELQFCTCAPVTAAQAAAAENPSLTAALHLGLLNRGTLLTPFHNMMLAGPATGHGQVARLLANMAEMLTELGA
ncbi:aspartate aminotransferase family protein [Silvimonas amylolytica]|uniref:Aspartate aminotransferase family protein n=1 Tax=Silvimonas amylolytica TaxID=449663 RepID=A0ABQ2PM04_9NEIS|nr:aspartate aminotransferase family protein [Silvimonas amylolytica]GGP26441.1 aspartate aminotransferase family protein [Silvimonas amylolytica]